MRQSASSAVDYEESKAQARNPDPAVRVRLSSHAGVRPEILYYLAEDASPEVRQAVARNAATPFQANLILARDNDEAVRKEIAAKVARLTPELCCDRQDKVQQYTIEVLSLLARDEATRVRRILAEALKDVVGAPQGVIQRLAEDVDDLVANPILQCSPILSDKDLIDIIQEGCASARLSAISRRYGLGEAVADAIVATEDVAAITTLLDNETAQIRETTLDSLVEQAAGVPVWHEPLVRRPKLSPRAARKLASFIGIKLLERLHARRDLDEKTLKLVADAMDKRLGKEQAEAEALEGPSASEADILRAIGSGDRPSVCGQLAELSGLPLEIVERIITSGSAKGITALAWKARISMRVALQLQLRVAGISQSSALLPRDGTDFPLSDDEMEWQIEFFGDLSA